MIRNLEWYNLNEVRSWPIADQSTMVDDTGLRMSNNVLADINIWFPKSAGDYAFLGAVTITENIATAILHGSGEGYPVIAAVSVASPVDPYVLYPVQALYPGVAGWIVFGKAITNGKALTHRFSTPEQSQLIPHVARRYSPPPIDDVAKVNALTKLTGVVRLRGGDDIEIVQETREINDVAMPVGVIRLKSKPEFFEDQNLLEKYAGPCGARPESNNCGQPSPIEFVNSIVPDCCGNITLEFRGCADVRFIQNEPCSVAVGCNFGLSEACITPDRLPDETGKLPNEYPDVCVEESIISSENDAKFHFVAFANPETTVYIRAMAPEELDTRLPYTEDFSDRTATSFKMLHGRFEVVADNELPLYGGYSLQTKPAGRCLALLKPEALAGNWSSYFKRINLHFSMRKGPAGALHNAGVMFNYNEKTQSGWAVEVDHEGTFTGYKCLRLARYVGGVSTTYVNTPLARTVLNMQYNLDLTILPAVNNGAWITAVLTTSLPPDHPQAIYKSVGPFLLPSFEPADGLFGLVTHRAVTQFNRLIISNVEK